MCGLVAVVNKFSNGFTKDQLDVFNTLLYIDVLRGEDSTGVFSVDNSGSVTVIKEASEAARFQSSKEYEAVLSKAYKSGTALIGHNRKATRGTINDDNAHPFIVDDSIVLVHNGTLFGDHKKHADVEVDSHALAHLIHQEKDVETALSKVDGAYALMWYDVNKEQINFVRNSARPLFWMETDNAYIWSSQQNMLSFVRSQYALKYRNKFPEINDYTENTLTTYSLKNRGVSVDSKKLTIKREAPKSYYQGGGYYEGGASYTKRVLPRDVNMACGYFDYDEVEDVIPTKVVSTGARREVEEYELMMVKTANKYITYAELAGTYDQLQDDKKAYAQTFDYFPKNGHDGSEGWWLYMYLLEEPDVMVKFWAKEKHFDEKRVMEIASSECIYEVVVGNKSWRPIETGAVITNDTKGFVMIEAKRALLKQGLGMTAGNH